MKSLLDILKGLKISNTIFLDSAEKFLSINLYCPAGPPPSIKTWLRPCYSEMFSSFSAVKIFESSLAAYADHLSNKCLSSFNRAFIVFSL